MKKSILLFCALSLSIPFAVAQQAPPVAMPQAGAHAGHHAPAAASATTAQSEAKTKAEINCLASTQTTPDAKQDKAPNHPKRTPLPDGNPPFFSGVLA